MDSENHNAPPLPLGMTPESLLDDLPVSLMIYSPDGVLRAMNRAAEAFWAIERSAAVGQFNLLNDPQSVAQGSRERFARALGGELIVTEAQLYDMGQLDVERRDTRRIWFIARMFALRGPDGTPAYVALIHEDVTGRVESQEAIQAAQAEIAEQREAINALSSPIIQVWDGILTVPLAGVVDSRRLTNVTEMLLEAIVAHQADIVILDLTGVPVVDTQVASAMLQTARAVRLLGCQPVLVGVGAEIAQTLVQLGIDLTQITTLANLKAGIAWAFARQGLAVGPA